MIDVRDLFCIHRGAEHDVAAVRGLTMSVGDGERVLIHGPSGSGKTSLLRVLGGWLVPSAGSATVLGVEMATASATSRAALRRRSLATIDQHALRALRPELDVLANVSLQLSLLGVSRAERTRRATALLERLGIEGLAHRRPTELSGGQSQRAAIAAAIAHGPRLLLADEPTGELDARSADDVYDLLAALAADFGATLVVVSHDVRAARIVDRVLSIRDGRVSEERARDGHERLVVDDRGWVRLPEAARRAAGVGQRAEVVRSDGELVLRGDGEPVLEAKPAEARATPGPVVARLAGVVHGYGPTRVLDGFDLEARAGQMTVLRGRSGSGKTTILRLLAGLERPQAGEVTVAGAAVGGSRTARAEARRHRIALAGQGGGLAEALDAAGNVAAALALRGTHGDPAGEVAGVGLGELAGREVGTLSGGERQRVAVARALGPATPVVLLDEPTSQLDEGNAERLARLLVARARAGQAIVVATHDPVLVAAADVVVDVEA